MQDKKIPIAVNVKDDKQHMIDFSIMYAGVRNMNFEKKSQATKGVKSIITRMSWTRLNAFGGGEKLLINAEGTPMKTKDRRADYGFEAKLIQPDILKKNANMEYAISRRQELSNVFFKKTDRWNVKYNFPITNILSTSFGFIFEDNYVDSDAIFFLNPNLKKYYKDTIIPISFVVDQTDNLLNPTSGYKIVSKFSYMRLSGTAISSLKNYNFSCSYHHPLDKMKKNILAFCISKKGIFSRDIDNVPIDKRIYSGGINSVRGYANQMATEMIQGADVTMGGKSAWEFNCEYRRKINLDWGVTTFFEGAKIHNNKSKYFETEKKRWFLSVGAGLRYYTSIGPIRLDFAFPIKRRKGIDSKMQFIMSLGQSF